MKLLLVEDEARMVRALSRRSLNAPDGRLRFADITLDSDTFLLSCATTGQSVRLSEGTVLK